MPRPIKERIDDTRAQVREQSPVGAAVTASPTTRLGAPRPYDPMQDIAEALSQVNPALRQYAQKKEAEHGDEQIELGRRARMMQEDNVPIAMTREQDPYWQKGYMAEHGRMMGIQDTADIQSKYDLAKDRPDFDLPKFLAAERKERFKGMTDPDALRGYTSQIEQIESKLRDDYVRVATEKVRVQHIQAFNTEISKHIADNRDRGVLDAAQHRDRLSDLAFAQGIGRQQFMSMYIKRLVSDPTMSVADLAVLDVPNSDGIKPYDMVDEKGNAWAGTIDKARELAHDRAEKEFAKKEDQKNIEFQLHFQKTLDEDPDALGDPMAFVGMYSYKNGPFDTDAKAAAAYTAIMKAKAEVAERRRFESLVDSLSPVPTMLRDNPQFKKVLKRRFEDNWNGVDWSDQNDVAKRMQTSMRLAETYGEFDPQIKGMADSVATMGTVTTAAGNEVFSPQLTATVSIFKKLRESNNPAMLAMFDDNAATFITTLDTMSSIMSAKEALAKTKAAFAVDKTNPTLVKSFWDKQGGQASAREKTAKALEGWFANSGNGWFVKVHNKEWIADKVNLAAATMFKAGGGALPPEKYMELARDMVLATHVYDGNRSMVQIPADWSKDRAREVFPIMLEQAQAQYAARNFGRSLSDDGYTVVFRQYKGQPMWHVEDSTGDVVVAPRDIASLEQGWRERNKATVEDAISRNMNVPTAPQADIYARRAALDERLINGTIDQQTYEREMDDLKFQHDAVIRNRVNALREARKEVPKLPPPKLDEPALRDPVPQPSGPELKTKDLSMKHSEADPEFALAVAGEGFRNVVYRDTQGKRTIGLGYNLDARTPEQVRKDFAKAGITDPARQSRVMAGEEAITSDEGRALYRVVAKDYAQRAKNLVGAVWETLAPHQRAVLTDLSYQTGTATFKRVWEFMSKGDMVGATKTLAQAMGKGGERGAARRMNLRLAMWESPARFQQLVEQGV